MPTVKEDAIEGIEAEEQDGVIVKLTRRMIVTGLSANDYTALFSALSAVGLAGTSVSEAPNCVVRRRRVKMLDKTVAEVIVDYEHAYNEAYDMDSPFFGVVLGESTSSLNQTQSNKDKDDATISVSHTYPSDDKDYPSKTLDEGATIDYLQPQHTLRFIGLKFNDTPGATSREMLGKTNDATWNGGVAGTWMCSKADFKLWDKASSPDRFFWVLEFQYNSDGWDPSVVFKDDRTDKPPVDLVDGTGFKVVERYEQIDFDVAFGATLVGA